VIKNQTKKRKNNKTLRKKQKEVNKKTYDTNDIIFFYLTASDDCVTTWRGACTALLVADLPVTQPAARSYVEAAWIARTTTWLPGTWWPS
jgi:hypothetical protein